MAYTIVDDGDEINIRAVITQRWELAELVTKLQQRVDRLPVNLTTMIPDGEAKSGHIVNDDPGQGYGVTATVNVKDGAVTGVVLNNQRKNPYEFDKINVNRKELSNE